MITVTKELVIYQEFPSIRQPINPRAFIPGIIQPYGLVGPHCTYCTILSQY
jgi:hypothetical protein